MFGLLFNHYRTRPAHHIKRLQRFAQRFAKPLSATGNVLSLCTFIAAVALMVLVVVYAGFDHTDSERLWLMRGMRCAQAFFAVNVAFNLLFNRGQVFNGAKVLSWIANAAVLITLLPWIYPQPQHPWFPWLKTLLYSNYFLFTVLILYSIIDISYSVMRVIGKRTNPSLLLSASFLVFIVIGSFLLMLPRCSYYGMSYADSLYLATSAICITGLTPVDIASNLTPFGICVLAVLIQAGALGVMTFTSFFALFFSGSASIYNQLLLRDIIYSKTMSSLFPTLLYVFGFTLGFELIGALMIFVSVHGTLAMTTNQEIGFALFHSLSAFCNAGFSTLHDGMANRAILYHNTSIYWVMSFIIACGSIGFPILVNFKDVALTYVRRLWHRLKGRKVMVAQNVHIYSMNTKIVLVTTTVLFAATAVTFYLFEYNHSLKPFDAWQKVTQAVFNAVTPRSAGFSSVSPTSFLSPTLVIIMAMMWIGGASQSTAGGIKVNTFAAICLNLRAIIFGRERVVAFKRTIAIWSIRQSNAVVAISILAYTLYSVVILLLEPALPAKALLFETLSALFTVGSSFGITDQLSIASKLVMCTAMFIGRIGILTLLTGLAGRHRANCPRYPSDNIIIN